MLQQAPFVIQEKEQFFQLWENPFSVIGIWYPACAIPGEGELDLQSLAKRHILLQVAVMNTALEGNAWAHDFLTMFEVDVW